MSEKRQFKIYAKRHVIQGRNQYEMLFDAIDDLADFDEQKLKTILEEAGVSTRFLKADMNYLYHSILKCLVIFHSGKSAQMTLNEMLSVIEILYLKGNYQQCIKEIYKAQQIARETELYSTLLKIIQYEKTVNLHVSSFKRSEEEVFAEMHQVNTLLSNISAFEELHFKAHQLRISISKTRDNMEMKKLDKLMLHPLLLNDKEALCNESKIKLFQIYAIHYHIQHHQKKELQYNRKIIALMDKYPLFKREHLLEYVNTYSRIVSVVKNENEYLFYEELNKVRSLQISTDELYFTRVSAQIFNFSYMIELSMYLQKKYFDRAATIIPDIENGIKKYKDILIPSYRITFLYMLAYYFFCIGNFDAARKRINMLLNEYAESDRPDIYNFAKLLNLFIHFEMGNYEFIHYKQANIKYYFKKQAAKHALENAILEFFSKEKNYTQLLSQSLQLLIERLQRLQKDETEKFALNYFDVVSWIKTKQAKKKSISEFVNS